MRGRKLLFGVGINDADYEIGKSEKINGRWKTIWLCPFYKRWHAMLKRCYHEITLVRQPTYMGCAVCDEWLYFSKFKAWMEQQDWEGKHLDKDIIEVGSRVYSPDTCAFVSSYVNTFIGDNKGQRGDWPIGVSREKNGKFMARAQNVLTGKSQYLGSFCTPEEAHAAWLAFKLEQAKILSEQQTDERVARALVSRYENYK